MRELVLLLLPLLIVAGAAAVRLLVDAAMADSIPFLSNRRKPGNFSNFLGMCAAWLGAAGIGAVLAVLLYSVSLWAFGHPIP